MNSLDSFLSDYFTCNLEFNKTNFFELLMNEIIEMKDQIISKLANPNLTKFSNLFEKIINSTLKL